MATADVSGSHAPEGGHIDPAHCGRARPLHDTRTGGAQPLAPARGARPLVWLVAIVALGSAVRFLFLGHRSLWLDEAISVSLARMDWQSFAAVVWNREGNMGLYYVLLRFWVHFFGDGEWAVRSLSALFSIATVAVLYALGRALFGTRVAWLGTLLFALNAFHVRYAQEARGYSQLAFFVTLSSLCLVEAVEAKRIIYWIGYIASVVLATYSHLFGVLVLPAHWVALVLGRPHRTPWRALALSSLAIAVLLAPLGIFLLTTEVWQVIALPPPGPSSLRGLLFALVGGSDGAGWLYVCAALAGVIANRRALAASDRPERWGLWLILAWFATPIALAFALSAAKPIFQYKYLIFCLPPYLLLAALGLAAIRSRRVFAVALGVMVVVAAYRVVHYYGKTSGTEDWRAATQFVLTHTREGDAIVFYEPYVRVCYEYYRTRLPAAHPAVMAEVVADPAAVTAAAGPYGRVWLVLSHVTGGDDRPVRSAFAGRYRLAAQQEFPGVRVLEYRRN
jgi:mannosyltransferase